jgi:FeS assembly SUF system regulator
LPASLSMLRIAKLTDYATVVLAALAERPETHASAAELAARARLEPTTVSKVLKTLAQAGLVESRRGAAGGYRLGRAPAEISVADVIIAMEGPIGLTECQLHAGLCHHEAHCGVRGNWQKIGFAIETALRNVRLVDLVPSRRRLGTIPVLTLPADVGGVEP